MKTLLVYYSRTGSTENVMKKLSSLISVERTIKIRPKTPRDGFHGLLRCFLDVFGKPGDIEPHDVPPVMADYDLVIIGTPIWAGGLSGPVKAFMSLYGGGIKKYALVEVSAGPPTEKNRAAAQLDAMTGTACTAALSLSGKEFSDDKLSDFVSKLN